MSPRHRPAAEPARNPAGSMLSPAWFKSSFAHVPATMRLVWGTSRAGTAALGGLTLLSAVFPLAITFAGKGIIDSVVARDAHLTMRWVLVELGLVAGLAAIQAALSLVRTVIGARLSLDINVLILEKALTLELRHFEDPEFYDQLTKARREASTRPLSVVTRSFQLVQSAITLVGYGALLLHYSALAVLGLVLAAIPATVAEMRFSGQAFRMRGWRSPDARRLLYLEYVLANDDHAKEVKLFGLGPLLLGRYKKLGEQFYREDRALSVKRSSWGYALSLLATLAFYGCYVAMALAAAAGRLGLGAMTLYMASFRQGQQAFQALLGGLGGMYEDNLYMSNLFDFLAYDTRRDAAASSVTGGAQAIATNGAAHEGANGASTPTTTTSVASEPPTERGIRFDDVGFRYPGRDDWALRHVSLFVPAGESIALVGSNGAGKTTFIKLLTRLYVPTEGRVLLDGKDLASWNDEELRKRIGVIFQDFNQYQFTAKENVAVGSVDHLEETPRVERAVERGGAEGVVASLKAGLETQLGRWFKDGTELSGGQWQKMALARAFMREGADILVLDEPTAALDAEAEHAVFERFRRLTQGRTSILISHRFPTVRMADRILVLDGGHILEEGTHEELLAQGGRYAHLFQLQARGYT